MQRSTALARIAPANATLTNGRLSYDLIAIHAGGIAPANATLTNGRNSWDTADGKGGGIAPANATLTNGRFMSLPIRSATSYRTGQCDPDQRTRHAV